MEKKGQPEAGEVLAPLEAALVPEPQEAELPGGFLGALAETMLRSLFFYPGITSLGMLAVGLREGWPLAPLGLAAFWAATLLWGACLAHNSSLETVADSVGPTPMEEAGLGPTLFSQLFEGLFRVVDLGLGDEGDGCLGALATFGITMVLFLGTLGLALALLPVIAFAWSPSWLRAALVLVPPLPLTSLFAVVSWVGLRRRMKARDLRVAAREAAAELPEASDQGA